jgi:hypothetical protein
MRLFRLWFGVSLPVGRRDYALSGVGLMLFKYAVEAAVVWAVTATVFWPWQFVSPSFSLRAELVAGQSTWLGWAWFAWTLPFLWIAVSMSVRRAADAGCSPWLGLFVLFPILNLLIMLVLSSLPSVPQEWDVGPRHFSDEAGASSAALAIGASLIPGGIMLVVSVYLLESYGASLFLGAPVLMGTTAGYLFNRPWPRGFPSSMLVGLGAILGAAVALLLFALEGAICIAMAVPLLAPLGALGGALGKAIAEATRRPGGGLAAAILALPLLAGGETLLGNWPERMVLTTVEIDAPPAVVWRNVVEFPELPAERPWYFSLGIACPERARIVGRGVGATRYCEFTTGTFVEPITAWDEPRRLAFDVTEQPPPMAELSPYPHVHPPHLEGFLMSTRGEFRLVPLAGGRTRLEGRTWYSVRMSPQWYWAGWSDLLIHRIHERVLEHIKGLSERG